MRLGLMLPPDLAARLASYRAETGLSPRDAALALLTAALDARDARRRGAAARWRGTTPEQRRAITEPWRESARRVRRRS